MKISASLIVKNEKDHLDDCLSSLNGIDEIIVIDTGSKDNTIEIAKKYTDCVYSGKDYIWKDDFSHSRNQSLAKCTGDWILIIDADETLQKNGINLLRKEIQKAESEGYFALSFDTISIDGSSTHKSIRAFKKTDKVKWNGAAHNYLSNVGKVKEVSIIIAYGYSTAHALDPERTFRILSKYCKEHPEASRERYYLAREYYYKKDYESAIDHWITYLKYSKFADEATDAYLMIARCLWLSGKGDEARKYCLEAIRRNPDFKEALELMSEMHYEPWKSKWLYIANNATNKDVLFKRRLFTKNNSEPKEDIKEAACKKLL